MAIRRFALIFGIIYLVVGIIAFIPGLLLTPLVSPIAVMAASGNLLGIFPVNAIHDLVHILIGIWGIATAGAVLSARNFARGLAIIYGVLFIFGFIPGLMTLFGLAPLYGNDVWLHLVSAIIAAYFGWGVAVEARARA